MKISVLSLIILLKGVKIECQSTGICENMLKISYEINDKRNIVNYFDESYLGSVVKASEIYFQKQGKTNLDSISTQWIKIKNKNKDNIQNILNNRPKYFDIQTNNFYDNLINKINIEKDILNKISYTDLIFDIFELDSIILTPDYSIVLTNEMKKNLERLQNDIKPKYAHVYKKIISILNDKSKNIRSALSDAFLYNYEKEINYLITGNANKSFQLYLEDMFNHDYYVLAARLDNFENINYIRIDESLKNFCIYYLKNSDAPGIIYRMTKKGELKCNGQPFSVLYAKEIDGALHIENPFSSAPKFSKSNKYSIELDNQLIGLVDTNSIKTKYSLMKEFEMKFLNYSPSQKFIIYKLINIGKLIADFKLSKQVLNENINIKLSDTCIYQFLVKNPLHDYKSVSDFESIAYYSYKLKNYNWVINKVDSINKLKKGTFFLSKLKVMASFYQLNIKVIADECNYYLSQKGESNFHRYFLGISKILSSIPDGKYDLLTAHKNGYGNKLLKKILD